MTAYGAGSGGRGWQPGFTVVELAITMVLMGLLLVPLLQLAGRAVGAARVERTDVALQTASEALIAFAAVHNGCLPFATDHEGGLPDTDSAGAAGSGYIDTGDRQNLDHAGDLPWAELGLTNAFLDGDNLRIQYYVATPYTDNNGNSNDGIKCVARFLGFEWDSSVAYNGSGSNPVYIYYDILTENPSPADRHLFKITGSGSQGLAAGSNPEANQSAKVKIIASDPLPTLLEVRRGPDVIAESATEQMVMSDQNVFVLIATGRNRNDVKDRSFLRDSNHMADDIGTEWSLQNITASVDEVVFSATRAIDDTDRADDGDDTLLIMSFVKYKAALAEYGLSMEASYCQEAAC